MKRIAMISMHTCPLERLGLFDAGGMNVYITNLAHFLTGFGWQVDIFTRSHPQRHRKEELLEPGVSLIHLPIGESVPKKQLINYTSKFAESIVSYARANKLDYKLLHAHYYLSGLAALVVREKLGIKMVQTFHTLAKLKEIHGAVLDKQRMDKECQLVVQADHLIVSTQLEANYLLACGAESKNISVVPPGVNLQIFRPRGRKISRKKLKLNEEKPTILFVGRIDPIKGISTLIKAVYLLSKKHEEFKNKFSVLLIGGDIENRKFWQKKEVKKIKKIIEQKKLDCCINFIGSVHHSQLPFYYSAADVVVLPSLYESFGLVALEAMACGSAVVASSVGGLRFMITDGKNGLLFPRQNALLLAKAIWRLLTDKKLCRKLGESARQTAAKFSWPEQAQKVSKVYETILSAGDSTVWLCRENYP